MSTYQYYEFQAVDRPLTPEEQRAVAQLSSRVEPHPRRAIFVYNWSDFHGNPEEVLSQYYDAFLYMANWGSRQLMFRFPQTVLDLEAVQAYCQPRYVEEYISLSTHGQHIVLNIYFHDDLSGGWIEGEGWLDPLLPLRDDILRGDFRALYLAWLRTLEMEYVPETVIEPPVPPGLRRLSPALEHLIKFFKIDQDLVEVAAEASPEPYTPSEDWIQRAIPLLTREVCEDFLLRLARGEPHLDVALTQHLQTLTGEPSDGPDSPASRRTVGQLWAEVRRRQELARQRAREEAERRRRERLEALAQRKEETWQEVYALIEKMQGKPYDEAVALLGQLQELAQHQGQEQAFQERLDAIWEAYPRRRGLLRRLREAGLVSSTKD
jgi:hypothetical protein